jgi:hypothetical protein
VAPFFKSVILLEIKLSCNNQQRVIAIFYLLVDKLMDQSHTKIGAPHGFDANSVFRPTNVLKQRTPIPTPKRP